MIIAMFIDTSTSEVSSDEVDSGCDESEIDAGGAYNNIGI